MKQIKHQGQNKNKQKKKQSWTGEGFQNGS